jgi:hypothetical protein
MNINEEISNKDTELELLDSLKHIVDSITIKDRYLIIKYKYAHKKNDFEIELSNDWDKLQQDLKNKLNENQITDTETLDSFYKTLNWNQDKIINQIGKTENKKDEEKDKEKKFITKTFKITYNGKLYESIIIVGHRCFLTYNTDTDTVKIVEEIEEDEKRAFGPMTKADHPYQPYIFSNIQEIQYYINLIKNKKITIDSIFKVIRNEISKYIIHDNYVLDYITALIILSYFQDFFGTVPYAMFVSDNSNGKTAIGNFFDTLAYRTVNMTDPTVANVFRIFGTLEPGQCTLVLDEAEKIDKDTTMMSILKTGYENGKKVQRINPFTNEQDHFHTFGLKLMLAERTPGPNAKGVIDRTFVISNYKGKPKLDIKEIKTVKNTRNDQIKLLLDAIRNILLVFRIVNFDKPFIDIETGLEGRNKEICKPLLQVFYKTEVQEKIENALEILLKDKQRNKENSLEKVLLEIVYNLLDTFKNGNIPFSEIWDLLQKNIVCDVDPFKPSQLEGEMYGTIYKRTISNILRSKFGAKSPEKRNSQATYLFFEDKEKIKNFLDDYNQNQLKITCSEKICESSECNEYDIKKIF